MTLVQIPTVDIKGRSLIVHWSKLDHIAFLGVGLFILFSYWLGGRAVLAAGILWLVALAADLAEGDR